MLPPVALQPPAPFPLVVAQAALPAFVAPAIRRADYRLTTSAGPLVVHVVALDPRDPNVKLRVVLAHDRLISGGETVLSMAQRTHAVAGVNADYFDIGNTNQPLNAVVADGALLRTPSKRAVLTVRPDGSAAVGTLRFGGSVSTATTTLPLTGINEFPPQGGVSLITGVYGRTAAAPGVTLVRVAPSDAAPGAPGRYTVLPGAASADATASAALAFGPAALRLGPPPSAGDVVQIAYDTDPAVASLQLAVGGGPRLLADGAAFDDPDSPAPEERDVRFPVSGAGIAGDGTLLLVAVDGRRPERSIGLTRPEFGALLRGLGAVDGLAFDSGGSATLVARVLGDADASVVNDPSDGVVRPVADGLFAYSTAPAGGDPQLVVRPAGFAAFGGARVALHGAVVDPAGHRLRAATLAPLVSDPRPGEHTVRVREQNGPLAATLAYHTVVTLAALRIVPERPNPAPGAAQPLALRAVDARGDEVELGGMPVPWTLARGDLRTTLVASSTLTLPPAAHDTTVTVALGGTTAATVVRVGSHVAPVAFAPLEVPFDFTGAARAAYGNVDVALPGEPSAVALDVQCDGSGIPLRAAFVNRFGERRALTLAAHCDWQGWQRRTLELPPDLNPPIRLVSLYAVPSLGGPRVARAGTVRFRGLAAVLPGER